MVASLSSKNAFIMYFRNFICAAMMDAYRWKWTNLNSNNLFSKLVSPQYSELNGIAFVYSQLYVAFLFIEVLFCFPLFCCLHVKMQMFDLELKVTGFGKRIKYIVCVFPMNNLNYDTPLLNWTVSQRGLAAVKLSKRAKYSAELMRRGQNGVANAMFLCLMSSVF